MVMNRRSLFSLFTGAAVIAAASRVGPIAADPIASVEYDLGGPHAWGPSYIPRYVTGIMDPGHSHQLCTSEMPTHAHTYTYSRNLTGHGV